MRGWLLLRAFGIAFDYEVVPLDTPEFDEYTQAHYPILTVPALQALDGECSTSIWDSLSITEFLHEQHPDAGYWPDDKIQRALARSLTAEMHSSFLDLRGTMPTNFRRVYQSFVPCPEAQVDIDRVVELWDWAASQWGDPNPYMFGQRYYAVDAFYTPVASRFHTYGVQLPERAQRYADSLLSHPAALEFIAAGEQEPWVLATNEFDIE